MACLGQPSDLRIRLALDLVSDSLSNGRRFRILCAVDERTRECLALVADTLLPGLRVAGALDAMTRWAWRQPRTLILSGRNKGLTSLLTRPSYTRRMV